jgi:hypothetical protein
MKNFISVNLVTYSKEHLSIILKHNIERKNFDKPIPYLAKQGEELDKNVNLTFSNFEELENKRQNYLKSKNKNDYMQKHLVEFVVSLSYDKVKEYLKDNIDIDKGFIEYAKDLKTKYGLETLNLDIHKDEFFEENGEKKFNYNTHILAYNYNFDKNWIEKISYSTKNILEKAQNGLSTIEDERRSKETDDKLYKAITTILGVTTSFVAPIIEIIIIFLPEIVRFISGKAKEKQQKEKISEQISISIIPEIKRKLRETIPQIFNDYLKNTIETISQEFETQLEQKRQEIIVTQQDKEDNIKDIEQEILKLENIKKELQFLATKNLYNQGK